MQRRILLLGSSLLLLSSIIIWSCTKLDTTQIGSDQIPAVDNVHTFADTLQINATQGTFFQDSTAVINTGNIAIGRITGDPLFGSTIADGFVQLKPTFFPFYYGTGNDTINPVLAAGTRFDSVVLCLSYKGFYGDSLTPMTFTVKTINRNNGIWDSIYRFRNVNFAPTTGATIGTKTVDLSTIGKNYMVYSNHRDSSINQVRIKLDASFANALLNQDTTAAGPNNGLRSDSLFKIFNNGLGIFATSGNGLAYFNFSDTNTKIEVHYIRRVGGSGGILDTGYASFKLSTSNSASSTSNSLLSTVSSTGNHIVRSRPSIITNPPAVPTELYIQTQPGTYANLNVPALATMPNRIIHRAELIIQQIPDNLTTTYPVPSFLYVDLKDSTTFPQWKPIYTDLNPSATYNPDTRVLGEDYYPSTGVYLTYYGGYARDTFDKFGNATKYYNINITRYIQQLVTKHIPNYTMRLWAPSQLFYPQMTSASYRDYNNFIASGRVKIGSGTNPNYKMLLRIVYSNL